ncbi:MAG: oxidoreductase [Actinocatenispora sp.]
MRISRALGAVTAATVAAASLATAGTALAGAASAAPASTHHSHQPHWRVVHSGTGQYRGLAAVSSRIAWVAGTDGTDGQVLRTLDGGRHWSDVTPTGTEGLEFRDIEASDPWHAVALTIGEGDASRIYVTDDGGRHWSLAFRNTEPKAFYDCTAFYDRWHGLAMSDPVDGKFRILSTSDAGHHWRVLPSAGMPAAQTGEAGFAGSGTCLATAGRTAYLASGGGAKARVYRSTDGGYHWSFVDTDVASSASAGIFSLAFRDPWHGIAIGGDYLVPDDAPHALARTADGGRSWPLADDAGAPGQYRSGSAWRDGRTVLVVGPTGSDISVDAGRTWTAFDTGTFDAVQCAHGACWASGADARIGVLER